MELIARGRAFLGVRTVRQLVMGQTGPHYHRMSTKEGPLGAPQASREEATNERGFCSIVLGVV